MLLAGLPNIKYLLVLLVLPGIVIGWMMDSAKRKQNESTNWSLFKEWEGLKLFRSHMEETLPDHLDVPAHSDDLYVCRLKAEPAIPELEQIYFDTMHEVETERGVYLIAFHEKGKGMSLCCIEKESKALVKVKDLEPLRWKFVLDKKDNLVYLRASQSGQKFEHRVE